MYALGFSLGMALAAQNAMLPGLDLDFVNGGLDPRIVFSRAGLATYVDATGKLTYAPNNLLTYSEQFDHAVWSKTNVTVTPDAAVAPNGTLTADLVTKTGTDATTPSSSKTVTATPHVASVYAKYATGGGWLRLRIQSPDTTISSVWFDLQNGVIGTKAANITATMTRDEYGFWRCSAAVTFASAGSAWVGFAPVAADNLSTSASGEAVYMWGAHLEAVTYQTAPRAYQVTTNAAYYGPRFEYDPVTLQPRGLLIEEARTNYLQHARNFAGASWGSNAVTIAPNAAQAADGTAAAQLLTQTNNAVNTGYIYTSTMPTALGTYTVSVLAKKGTANGFRIQPNATIDGTVSGITFEISLATLTVATTPYGGKFAVVSNPITPLGGGWYLCSVTYTTSGTAAPASLSTWIYPCLTGEPIGRGTYLDFAQGEAGPFATSRIVTDGGSASRAADDGALYGTAFASWFNATAGSFVVEADTFSTSFPGVFTVNDGTQNNRIYAYMNGSNGRFGSQFKVAGAGTGGSTADISTPGAVFRGGVSYDGANTSVVNNGGGVAASGLTGLPVVNRLDLGTGDSRLNGHLRRLRYWPTRLTDAQLQGLTA